MRRTERISLQLSLLDDKEFETDMQCPDCKSRRGYYKYYSRKSGQKRIRILICKKCAVPQTSVEIYPDGFSPDTKFKVKKSFPSLHARHRVYWTDKSKSTTFSTEEKFEHAEPQYKTVDTFRHR